MGSRSPKKLLRVISEDGEEDRISKLPDDLIHRIQSFLDTKEAVQTCVLSKRWKLVWTTLPILRFHESENSSSPQFWKLIRHVMSKRDTQSQISALELCVSKGVAGCLRAKFIEYAMTHNVEHLNLDLRYKQYRPYKLSTLSSTVLKTLVLRVKLDGFNAWNLPALTTLHLKGPVSVHRSLSCKLRGTYKLPGSCFTCLPALRTLCLESWDFSRSTFSFSLPHLETLRLFRCAVTETGWNFPSLLTLELDDVVLMWDINHILSTLVKLENLTFFLIEPLHLMKIQHSISCPQLLNLTIKTSCRESRYDTRIPVFAPKLRNFTAVGIFTINFEFPVETVNLKLNAWFEDLDGAIDFYAGIFSERLSRKEYYVRFADMLTLLGNAKNLTFDLGSIEVLSTISNILENMPSPFYNVKFVKLPHGYKESSITRAVRKYLLSGSPSSNIVTTFPQSMIPDQTVVDDE